MSKQVDVFVEIMGWIFFLAILGAIATSGLSVSMKFLMVALFAMTIALVAVMPDRDKAADANTETTDQANTEALSKLAQPAPKDNGESTNE